MNNNIAETLNECIVLVASGMGIEEALTRYPEQTDEIKPLVQTAILLRQIPQAIPSPEAKAAGRQRSLVAVERKRQTRARWGIFRRTLFVIKTQLESLFSIPSEALRKL